MAEAAAKRNLDSWRDGARRRLPPESETLERNGAITHQYVRWYRSDPLLFQWAGVAAFASFRVKLYLERYERKLRRLGIEGAERDWEFKGLEGVRLTNNRIYRDVAWAFDACLHPDGGVDEVIRLLESVPDHALMLEAFHDLRRAGQLRDRRDIVGAREAAARGNERLLRHEQVVIVQPQIETLGRFARVWFSLLADFDFDADHSRRDRATYTRFVRFMLTRGLGFLLKTRSLPDVARLDHRWYWTEHRIIPLWNRVRAQDLDLEAKLTRMGGGDSR